jgi:hypothetical protein
METRDLDLIAEKCIEAQRLADQRGDKLLSYFLGMALAAVRDAKKTKKGNGGRAGRGRRRR